MNREVSDSRRVYAALAAGVFFISFSAIFVKWAQVPGLVSALYRMAIGALALTPIMAARRAGWPRLPPRALALAALGGVFFAADIAVWNTALGAASAANATLLGNTAPIWVALGAWLLFGQRPSVRFWAGLSLALAGAAIIVGGDLAAGLDFRRGNLLALVGGFMYAMYQLTTFRARARLDTVGYHWLVSTIGALLLLPLAVGQGLPLWGFGAQTWLALLGLALVTHVAGWLSITYAFGHLPPSLTSASLLAQPVLTAVLAVPLLGEGLLSMQLVGGGLVLAGIYIVNRRRRTR